MGVLYRSTSIRLPIFRVLLSLIFCLLPTVLRLVDEDISAIEHEVNVTIFIKYPEEEYSALKEIEKHFHTC